VFGAGLAAEADASGSSAPTVTPDEIRTRLLPALATGDMTGAVES
jgi:hypothetical protein